MGQNLEVENLALVPALSLLHALHSFGIIGNLLVNYVSF